MELSNPLSFNTPHEPSLLNRADPAPSLPPPKIPAAEVNGGLGFHDLNDPLIPVLVTAVGYQGMTLNDLVELVWGGTTVSFFSVRQEHIDTFSLTFSVLPQYIVPGTASLFYRVTGAVGGNIEVSYPYTVVIKNTIPGNPDPDPATPTINENLTLPGGIPEFIGDTEAANGINVSVAPYQFMAVGDTVTLYWGGNQFQLKYTVLDTSTPISLFVGPDIVIAPGAGPLIVRYEIRDTVNNWSLYSPSANTDIEAGSGIYPAPRVLNAVSDDDIDLAELGTNDVRIVLPVYPDMLDGDHITLTWSGQTGEGTPVPEVKTHNVIQDDVGFSIELTIKNATVRAIGGGEASVLYDVQPLIGLPHRSRRKRVTVSGQAQALMLASVLEAPDNQVLDPALVPETGATVIIAPYDPIMQAGDHVYMTWSGTTELGDALLYTDDKFITGAAVGLPVIFTVPKLQVAPLGGGKLSVSYKVVTFNRAVLESPPLLLNVVGGGALLPLPIVDHTDTDGVLDPILLPASGTKLRVPASAALKSGDTVNLSWQGALAGGSTSDTLPINEASAGKEAVFEIPLQYVTANLNGSVQASYQVKRASGGTQDSLKLALQIRAAISLRPPAVEEAKGSNNLNPIDAMTSLTVVVPGVLQTTDLLDVTWTGAAGSPAGGSHTTTAGQVSVIGQKIQVPVAVIAFNLGKPVTVSYSMTRDGAVPQLSEPFTLNVLVIPQTGLTKPQIREAANNGEGPELDVANLSADASIRLTNWPHIAVGQYVWLKLLGKKADGTNHELELWTQPSSSQVSQLWATQGYYDKAVPYGYLKDLGDGSSLVVEFKVSLNRTQNVSDTVDFPLRTYMIKAVALITPTISEVTDSQNTPIADGDTTVDNDLILAGTATPNMEVEIYQNATSMGVTVKTAANGIWTSKLIKLPEGKRELTAKALYGSGAVSEPWTVIVAEVVTPTIASVKDTQNAEIPEGQSTIDSTVIITGIATANLTIDIYDGATLKQTATTNSSGIWTTTLSGLLVAGYSITAKAKYGDEPVSAARTFKVVVPITPVEAGADKIFNAVGYHVAQGRPPLTPPAHLVLSQSATGGVPPYSYTSGNVNIAVVDALTGKVRVSGNGTAIITARDQSGRSDSYQITVTGAQVYLQVPSWPLMNWASAVAACRSFGGGLPLLQQWRSLRDTYKAEGPVGSVLGWNYNLTWTGTSYSTNHLYIIDPNTYNEGSGQYLTACAVICRLGDDPS